MLAKGGVSQQGFAFAATQTVVPVVGLELAVPRFRCRLDSSSNPVVCPDSTHVAIARTQLLRRTARTVARGVRAGGPARLPICLRRVEGSDKVVLCIDEDSGWIVDSDTNPVVAKFFEEDGMPSAATKTILDFVQQIEQSRIATDLALAALADAGVIQPWPLMVQEAQQQVAVKGLHCINEAALNALEDETFLKLRKSSALFIAQAQLMSMQTINVFRQLMAVQQQLAQQTKPLPEVSSIFLGDEGGTIKFN